MVSREFMRRPVAPSHHHSGNISAAESFVSNAQPPRGGEWRSPVLPVPLVSPSPTTTANRAVGNVAAVGPDPRRVVVSSSVAAAAVPTAAPTGSLQSHRYALGAMKKRLEDRLGAFEDHDVEQQRRGVGDRRDGDRYHALGDPDSRRRHGVAAFSEPIGPSPQYDGDNAEAITAMGDEETPPDSSAAMVDEEPRPLPRAPFSNGMSPPMLLKENLSGAASDGGVPFSRPKMVLRGGRSTTAAGPLRVTVAVAEASPIPGDASADVPLSSEPPARTSRQSAATSRVPGDSGGWPSSPSRRSPIAPGGGSDRRDRRDDAATNDDDDQPPPPWRRNGEPRRSTVDNGGRREEGDADERHHHDHRRDDRRRRNGGRRRRRHHRSHSSSSLSDPSSSSPTSTSSTSCSSSGGRRGADRGPRRDSSSRRDAHYKNDNVLPESESWRNDTKQQQTAQRREANESTRQRQRSKSSGADGSSEEGTATARRRTRRQQRHREQSAKDRTERPQAQLTLLESVLSASSTIVQQQQRQLFAADEGSARQSLMLCEQEAWFALACAAVSAAARWSSGPPRPRGSPGQRRVHNVSAERGESPRNEVEFPGYHRQQQPLLVSPSRRPLPGTTTTTTTGGGGRRHEEDDDFVVGCGEDDADAADLSSSTVARRRRRVVSPGRPALEGIAGKERFTVVSLSESDGSAADDHQHRLSRGGSAGTSHQYHHEPAANILPPATLLKLHPSTPVRGANGVAPSMTSNHHHLLLSRQQPQHSRSHLATTAQQAGASGGGADEGAATAPPSPSDARSRHRPDVEAVLAAQKLEIKALYDAMRQKERQLRAAVLSQPPWFQSSEASAAGAMSFERPQPHLVDRTPPPSTPPPHNAIAAPMEGRRPRHPTAAGGELHHQLPQSPAPWTTQLPPRGTMTTTTPPQGSNSSSSKRMSPVHPGEHTAAAMLSNTTTTTPRTGGGGGGGVVRQTHSPLDGWREGTLHRNEFGGDHSRHPASSTTYAHHAASGVAQRAKEGQFPIYVIPEEPPRQAHDRMSQISRQEALQQPSTTELVEFIRQELQAIYDAGELPQKAFVDIARVVSSRMSTPNLISSGRRSSPFPGGGGGGGGAAAGGRGAFPPPPPRSSSPVNWRVTVRNHLRNVLKDYGITAPRVVVA